MIADSIKAVKEAEARADEMVREARSKADETLRKAEGDAAAMKAGASEKELRDRQIAAARAEERTKIFVENARKDAEKEADQLRAAARKDEKKAVAAAIQVILGES
ncbi:MAG: hypothetical protein ACSW8H_00325 [bacterium]